MKGRVRTCSQLSHASSSPSFSLGQVVKGDVNGVHVTKGYVSEY